MRKEVKLGMAIGGGLIAVLVVYLFVAPPANNKNGAQLAGANGANGSIIEIQQPGEPLSGAAAGVDDKGSAAAKPSGDAGGGQGAQGNPPETHTTTHDASGDRPAAPVGRKGARDAWDKALGEGKTEKAASTPPAAPIKTGTAGTVSGKTGLGSKDHEAPKPAPTKHETAVALGSPAAGGSEPKLYFNPNEAWGGGVSTGAVFGTETHSAAKPAGGHSSSDGSAGSTGAGTGAKHSPAEGTYVVKAGDTLSSIASEAYGSAAYYPHILRANPTVNPNNLKLGTALILPKADDVKATANERPPVVASIVEDSKFDPKTQYQVQSGDSLYKISMKVYGKSGYVERIYEKNKALIGSDPKKLKLGMILELPEKTTVAAAGSASHQEASDETDRR
jgi:nucleoid-associated protein YgaU